MACRPRYDVNWRLCPDGRDAGRHDLQLFSQRDFSDKSRSIETSSVMSRQVPMRRTALLSKKRPPMELIQRSSPSLAR